MHTILLVWFVHRVMEQDITYKDVLGKREERENVKMSQKLPQKMAISFMFFQTCLTLSSDKFYVENVVNSTFEPWLKHSRVRIQVPRALLDVVAAVTTREVLQYTMWEYGITRVLSAWNIP